jgi:hypothetical protein
MVNGQERCRGQIFKFLTLALKDLFPGYKKSYWRRGGTETREILYT